MEIYILLVLILVLIWIASKDVSPFDDGSFIDEIELNSDNNQYQFYDIGYKLINIPGQRINVHTSKVHLIKAVKPLGVKITLYSNGKKIKTIALGNKAFIVNKKVDHLGYIPKKIKINKPKSITKILYNGRIVTIYEPTIIDDQLIANLQGILVGPNDEVNFYKSIQSSVPDHTIKSGSISDTDKMVYFKYQ